MTKIGRQRWDKRSHQSLRRSLCGAVATWHRGGGRLGPIAAAPSSRSLVPLSAIHFDPPASGEQQQDESQRQEDGEEEGEEGREAKGLAEPVKVSKEEEEEHTKKLRRKYKENTKQTRR